MKFIAETIPHFPRTFLQEIAFRGTRWIIMAFGDFAHEDARNCFPRKPVTPSILWSTFTQRRMPLHTPSILKMLQN